MDVGSGEKCGVCAEELDKEVYSLPLQFIIDDRGLSCDKTQDAKQLPCFAHTLNLAVLYMMP